MTPQLYLFARSDGGVSLYLHVDGEIAYCVAEWERVHPGVTVTETVPIDQAPAIDEYRNAWRLDGKAVVHDMPTAREIHRNKLRAERAPLLAALDVDYQRADEAEDRATKRSVAARKQALRDAPADPRIEAAATIEDLRAVQLPSPNAAEDDRVTRP